MNQTDKDALSARLDKIGMVTPTLAEGRNPDAVRDIDTITGEILEAKRVGGEAIITIGQRLIEAKALLPHGEWLNWLTEKVEFSERTAQRFMRLSREWTNPSALTDLGATKALQLLALPESERDEFIEKNNVVDMTSRELDKAIKERDDALKAAERAQSDNRAAQEARAAMEEQLKVANELLDLAKSAREEAVARIAGLEQRLTELQSAPVDVAVMQVDQEALDKARAEGEAAKAEEIAQLKIQLDKAKEAKKKADEKRKNAEAAVDILKRSREEAAKAKESAAILADPDMAKLEVYYGQMQETANKMRELLLIARHREDQTIAEKMAGAIVSLAEQIRGCAE